MKRYSSFALFLTLLGASLDPASATPVLAIDLNPAAAGIQSTLTVQPGATFSLAVVYAGDGTATFDTFISSINFNNNGAVLGLQGGIGNPKAGALANQAPVAALDIFGGVQVTEGGNLTAGPASLATGFTADSGLLGLNSINDPFPMLAAGSEVAILTLELVASALGTSTLTLFNDIGPILALSTLVPGGGLDTIPVDATLATGTVTVSAAVISEPSSLLAFAVGLFVLVRHRRGLDVRSSRHV